MFKKVVMMVVLVVMLFPALVQAETSSNTVLTLFDAVTKEPLNDIFINVEINGKINQYYIEKDKDFVLNLEKGAYDIKILANKLSTESYDYYSDFFLIVGESPKVKIIYLHPVGSLYGTVKDKLENVVAENDLHFECSNIISVDYPEKTNKFGSFSLNAVPVGNCEVSAIHENNIGTVNVDIQQGLKNNVEIKLEKSLITKDKELVNGSFLIAIIIFIIIILGVILYKFRRKLIPKRKLIEKETTTDEHKLGKRAKDILKTHR